MLASHLAYDTSKFQAATRWIGELQRRMVLLLPLLTSIGDRLGALRAANGITPGLDGLLAELRVWVRAGAPPPRSEADRMRGTIARLEAEIDPNAGWNEVMRGSLLRRLRQLVDLRQDMRDLRRHIGAGGGALVTLLTVQTSEMALLHRDHGLALLSAAAAALTIGLLCAFWISTAWPSGGDAPAFAAVACCLFAAQDDPIPALKSFLAGALLSVLAVGIGTFGILPAVHDFEILTLVLAAFFVPVGLLIARPATQPLGAAMGFLAATLLGLQGAYAGDFVTYANTGIAVVLGVACAAVMTRLMRSAGAEWNVRRLLRASWRDLAEIPYRQSPHDSTALSELLLDRLGLLVPRLAAIREDSDLAAVGVLTDLRVGINMVELQRGRDAMPPPVRAAVDRALSGAGTHFAMQAAAGRVHPPPPALLHDIDRALDAAIAMHGRNVRNVLLQLVGIRRSLFAAAPPYHPAPPLGSVRTADAAAREAA
jgi:uncharacterized membrane protein YccC